MKHNKMSLREKSRRLRRAIEDFKRIEGFSKKIIKIYESQLKEVVSEIEREKQLRKRCLQKQKDIV